MSAKIFSFDSNPPKIAYVDPSYFLNLLIEDSKYFKECRKFSKKLKKSKTILITSNLSLDEIYYTLLKIMASRDYGKEWRGKTQI